MTALDDISPAEIVKDILERWGNPDLSPSGIVIGPADDVMQQAGVVSVTPAGLPIVELYIPVQWMRAQVRCLAGTLDQAESIGQGVQRDLHQRGRTRARMASTDKWYLVHLCNVVAGPSAHYDSPETWETLLFAELAIGNQPIGW